MVYVVVSMSDYHPPPEQDQPSYVDPHDSLEEPEVVRLISRINSTLEQDQPSYVDPHDSLEEPKVVWLLHRLNTWKVFLIVLALVLIMDGFLFYGYQQRENSVSVPLPVASTAQGVATSANDSAGGRADSQSKKNDAQTDATQYQQQYSSSDLPTNVSEADYYPPDPTYEDVDYSTPDSTYEEYDAAYE